MARLQLNAVDIVIADVAERSCTTIGTVGPAAVIVSTALADRGVSLTSCYLADMFSAIAASHLSSARGEAARIRQRQLPGQQPGQTHARTCLLDHVAELQTLLAELVEEHVRINVGADALEHAAAAWQPHDPRS